MRYLKITAKKLKSTLKGESLMNLEEIIKKEKIYLMLFSNAYPFFDEVVYRDHLQRDKYVHNLLHVSQQPFNQTVYEAYVKEEKEMKRAIVRVEESSFSKACDDLLGEVSSYGYYHLTMGAFKQTKINEDCLLLPVSTSNDAFFSYMQQGSLPYGKSYALGNVDRQKQVLTAHSELYKYYQLTQDGNFIGQINVFITGDCAKIDDFEIIESKRNQGYGKTLLTLLFDRLANIGIKDIYLIADEEDTPKHFYEAYGFIKKGEFKQAVYKED